MITDRVNSILSMMRIGNHVDMMNDLMIMNRSLMIKSLFVPDVD